jgi:hypothetical protein
VTLRTLKTFHPQPFSVDLDQPLTDDGQDDDTPGSSSLCHGSPQAWRPTQNGWEKETMKHGESFENGLNDTPQQDLKDQGPSGIALIIVRRSSCLD